MIPRVASTGTSFRGAGLYYLNDRRDKVGSDQQQRPSAEAYMLYDKGGQTSQTRVGFTATRNLPTDNPQTALKCMSWLAAHAKDVRQAWVAARAEAAGMSYAAYVREHNPFRGRQGSKPVYTVSIAWHPSKQKVPNREQMLAAADEVRHALGMAHCQCLIVQHTDTKHPHVHLIINRVCPETGRYASTGNDFLKLSAWALEYERRTGLILCHERLFNWQRRDRERFAKQQRRQQNPKAKGRYVRGKNIPRRDFEWFRAHAHLSPQEIRAARQEQQARERNKLKSLQVDREVRHEGHLAGRYGKDLAAIRKEIDRLKYAEWWRKTRDRDPVALLLAPRHAFHAAVDLVTARAYFRPRRIRQLEASADALSRVMRSAHDDMVNKSLDEQRRIIARHDAEVRRDDERIEQLARRRVTDAAGERGRKSFNIRGDKQTAQFTKRSEDARHPANDYEAVAEKDLADRLRQQSTFARLVKTLGGKDLGRRTAVSQAPKPEPERPERIKPRPPPTPSFDTGEADPDYDRRLQARIEEAELQQRRQRRRRKRPRARSRRME